VQPTYEEGPVEPETPSAAPAGHGDFGHDDGEDDVDGIVDPLAGMRNEEVERYEGYDDEGTLPEPADDSGFEEASEVNEGWTDEGDRNAPPPLDLSEPMDEGSEDELQLSPDQLAEQSPLATKPDRGGSQSAGSAGGAGAPGAGGSAAGGAAAGGAAQGSTLFERMANLSRGSAPADEDDEDDDDEGGSGALNIPRFLGRQNNQ
jgi:cell division protein FtsZ